MSRAFASFERGDFSAAIVALEPIAGELERIGGSRAQLDLVEFTLLKAYVGADHLYDARHMLSGRHRGSSSARCRIVGDPLMRYSFYLPTRGPTATRDGILALAREGERQGLHSAMIADHIVLPVESQSTYPYTLDGKHPSVGDALETFSILGVVAGATERLRLVTSVLVLPYRNPVLTAKMAASLDVLSGGRLTLGVGAGWLKEEFEALNSPAFNARGAVTDEWITIFKQLWSQSPASFNGRFYRYSDIRCEPFPVQKPHPPIWVGGHSRAALRRTARHGDGWHPVGAVAASPLPPQEMRTHLDTLKQLTEAEGRDFSALTISYKAPLYDTGISSPDGSRRPFSGEPEDIAGDIRSFAAIGVHELIFDFRGQSITEGIERLQWFATKVIPLVIG